MYTQLTCQRCERKRILSDFRLPSYKRKKDGTIVKTHRMSDKECIKCFQLRMTQTRDPAKLKWRVERGFVNVVEAEAAIKEREVARRRKLSEGAKAKWTERQRTRLASHPLARELKRMKDVARFLAADDNAGTAPLCDFVVWYVEQLRFMRAQMERDPALTRKRAARGEKGILPQQDAATRRFLSDVVVLEREAAYMWGKLSDEDRGNFLPPKPLLVTLLGDALATLKKRKEVQARVE